MIIERISKQPFYYLRRVGVFGEENYDLMNYLKKILTASNLINKDFVIYAVPQITERVETNIYDVGIATHDNFELDELIPGKLLDGNYVIVEIEHTEEAVTKMWQELVKAEFYQTNNLVFDASRFIMERYKKELVEKGYCEFCIPVI